MSSAPATQSFKDAYATLERIRTHLTAENSVDVDQLVPMVSEAIAAHKVCAERIALVRAMLAAELEGEQAQ